MTTAGYAFLGLAWLLISALTIFCYKKILWDD
jgi:hypothetical protein